MIVAIAHCLKESEQAKRLTAWLAEIGPYPNHRLLVGRDARAEPNLFANSGFGSVEEITITGDAWNHWPESCNNAFRQIAKHVEYGTKEPWLWLEPDVVPLKIGWVDAIEAEHRASGKPFLGDFVHIDEPGFYDHMSGVAVYPGAMSHHAGNALLAHEMAWDEIGASQIIPQMHKSKSILHRWKYPAFDSWEQVEERIFAVKPECVLFHSDKHGSLIPLLRTKMNLPVPVLAESVDGARNPALVELKALGPETDKARESTRILTRPQDRGDGHTEKSEYAGDSRGGQFICDIFIKSFPGDYEWLRYCLRSIDKFAKGFRKLWILYPVGTMDALDENVAYVPKIPCQFVPVKESGEGYMQQMVFKLNADKYTDADYILFMDSDCVFTGTVTPETFMRDGKVMWLMTPFDKAREDQRAAWIPVMAKWMDKAPEFEFMNRHPFIFPRWFFDKIRGFCANQHGITLEEYIMKQPGRAFSEFNCAGFLAYEHFRDRFEWINTVTDQIPPETVSQKWSYGGLTEEIKAEFEEILKGGEDDNADSNAPALAENAAIRRTAQGIWILANDSHISKWVEEKGSLQHDYETLPQILAEIKPGDTVVDIGAFIGDSTGPFLERVGSDGEVFAYEPNMDAWECLKRNCPTAHCLPYALGVAGPSDAVFLELAPADNAGARYLRKSGFDKEQGYAVQIASLDSDNLKRCDLIKIDVEGMELSVLRGAEQTINRFHPKLVLEINEGALARQGSSAEEISDWLFKHGYKWRPLQSDITAASPQYDILCTWIQPAVSASTANGSVVRVADDSRENIVRDTVAILKALCTAPRYVSQVRRALHDAGIIKTGKHRRMRRRVHS